MPIEVKELTPDELGLDEFDGIRACTIGEDGDVLLIGHWSEGLTWQAFKALRRYEAGEWDEGDPSEIYKFTRGHAHFSDHSEACATVDCSCVEDSCCEPCQGGRHEDCNDSCLCADDFEHDVPEGHDWHTCQDDCCCDEYAWWVSEAKSGYEVTWIRYDWEKARALRETRKS